MSSKAKRLDKIHFATKPDLGRAAQRKDLAANLPHIPFAPLNNMASRPQPGVVTLTQMEKKSDIASIRCVLLLGIATSYSSLNILGECSDFATS